jgi:tetratricopeptide (TPR) repeat protein
MRNQPTDHYWWYNVAALLAMTHNRADYEQLCHKIPAFADSTNPYIVARVADGCLLLPDSGADLLSVDKLATKAVTLGTADGIGHFQAIKALSAYRAGRFQEAVEWAEKALKNPEVFARAKGFAVLAMAQWQLGLQDAARTNLSQGNILAPAISSTHADTVDLGGGGWISWLVARILLDEATELIVDKSTLGNDSKNHH